MARVKDDCFLSKLKETVSRSAGEEGGAAAAMFAVVTDGNTVNTVEDSRS